MDSFIQLLIVIVIATAIVLSIGIYEEHQPTETSAPEYQI